MAEAPKWVVDEKRTEDHWLEVADPEGWWFAFVGWDGCLEITRYFNEPATSRDKHPNGRPKKVAADDTCRVCDLDEYIARLQALKAKAIEHFGSDWPH